MVNSKYWNEKIETLPSEEIRRQQLQKLKEQVKYCYTNSVFYHKKFDSVGLKPEDIKTFADLQKIPFTVKADLKENYPYGMVAAPPDEIVEIHASSGTTGNPIVGAYTKQDIDVWQEIMARSIYTAGGRQQDVIHIAYGYGLFTGGFGFHYGAQKIGARIVPIGGGMTQRQISLMKDLNVTILACTPSFAVYLAETMAKEGVDPRKDLNLKRGIFGAEPWSQQIRQRIEKDLGIEAFDIYGLTELYGPGVSVECPEHDGLHVWEDQFIVETIDPDTGETLPDGEEGELVFTALNKTGLPILRYRTRDISKITREKCVCGRTHARMLRVTGRSDDMLIIRGVNVFPSQIEFAILQVPELAPQYLIVLDRPGALDTFLVKVELTEQAQQNIQLDLKKLKDNIQKRINIITGLSAVIEVVKPNELPRTEGKAKRVLDLRKGKM
ncbi:MAG: phenylacetate--CoA ligase [Candidatus Bathyarchaeota archaeon]|nr:phenylacetate--CoA ligase [Candidatus Termiticorpusculum sp.]MCL2868817.1 phenylacetate--CoA ligase [Candidatus Termiticorpusculum sp.]